MDKERETKYHKAWYSHIEDFSRLRWVNPSKEICEEIEQIQKRLREIVDKIDPTPKDARICEYCGGELSKEQQRFCSHYCQIRTTETSKRSTD